MVTRVKVCGLTTLGDAEAAIEAGADALGFVFDPASPRRVAGSEVPEQLGPFHVCVAVFGVLEPRVTGCAWTQCSEGTPEGAWIRTIRLAEGATVEAVLTQLAREIRPPAAVLLDALVPGAHGGTGVPVDWGLAADLVQALPLPVILAGGLHPGNVAQAVRQVRPYAVDASSGLEQAPGVKDLEKVRAFVAQAKGH